MTEKQGSVSHDGHRQRMKNRFLSNGLEGFSGHEVLELLLYYALPYKDTNGLGHQLEDDFGGLLNVLDADYADLIKVPGVTPHVATLIHLCGCLCQRYQREQTSQIRQLYSTEQLCRYVAPWFAGEREESVVLISLDNKYKLLNATRVFRGSVNSAEMNVRLAVQQALRDNATKVVLAHNHPGGFAIPSRTDAETTAHFAQALSLVDVRLIDHVVVADGECVSMAESYETAHLFGREIPPLAEVADSR